MCLVLFITALLPLTACSGDAALAPGASATPAPATSEPATRTATPKPVEPSPTVPRPTATFVPLTTPSPTPFGGKPSQADVPRISVAQARQQADAGEAILVDVRTSAVYEGLHIAGAISMPLHQVARRYAELPADKLLIFYCA